jgi:hypothetical protein
MGPPGLYGAIITGGSSAYQLRDGAGNPRAGLNAVGIDAVVGGMALAYVPDFKLFDGSVAFTGVTGGGVRANYVRLSATLPDRSRRRLF